MATTKPKRKSDTLTSLRAERDTARREMEDYRNPYWQAKDDLRVLKARERAMMGVMTAFVTLSEVGAPPAEEVPF